MGNDDTILVYHYRFREFEGKPLVSTGLGVVTQGELTHWLKKNPEYQATMKPLTTRHPVIYQRDLLTADQVAGFGAKGNYDQQRATVDVSVPDYYLHRRRELYIISLAPKSGEN